MESNPEDFSEKNQIEFRRKLRGLSQSELANLCSATQQQISHIESGRRKLTWDWMQRIASAIGCHPMELVYWDSEQHRTMVVMEQSHCGDSQDGESLAAEDNSK